MNDSEYKPYAVVDGARRPATCAEVLVEIILFLAVLAAAVYVWDW